MATAPAEVSMFGKVTSEETFVDASPIGNDWYIGEEKRRFRNRAGVVIPVGTICKFWLHEGEWQCHWN